MILSYFLSFPFFFFFFFFVMKLDAVEWLGNVSLRAKNEGLRVRFNVKFLFTKFCCLLNRGELYSLVFDSLKLKKER